MSSGTRQRESPMAQTAELAALPTADRCVKPRRYIALDEVFLEMGKLASDHPS